MDKIKIVFLLDSISQPRCLKRINSFIDNGFDVEIYGINRNKYNINAEFSKFEFNIIGNQKLGKDYFFKLFNNFIEIRSILKKYKNENVLYYSFGFPLTLTIFLNRGQNYIYEIADILYGYRKFNGIRWLLKFIDKKLINSSALTVFTSEGFNDFFSKGKNLSNVIVQPNRVLNSFSERSNFKKCINTKAIIFAFIGGFRSPNTIFRFARIIGEYFPQHQFHFYGDSHLTDDVVDISKKYSNIKYFGAFRNPEDLSTIYANIDIVISCYDIKDFNERILEPNKLYESLYFLKPIIVSKNTYLAKRVNNLGCGFEIDATSDQNIINFVNSLNIAEINEIKTKIENINTQQIVDDNSKKIIEYIKEKYK